MAESSMESSFAAEGIYRHSWIPRRDATLLMDPAEKIVLVNTQTEKIFEFSREEFVAQPLELLVPERSRERHAGHRAAFPRAPRARPTGAGLELLAQPKNRKQFPETISLILTAFRRVKLVCNSIMGIKKRKSAGEAQRRLRKKEAFLNDIYHMVKDNLQVVSSLLNRQAGRLADPAARRCSRPAIAASAPCHWGCAW